MSITSHQATAAPGAPTRATASPPHDALTQPPPDAPTATGGPGATAAARPPTQSAAGPAPPPPRTTGGSGGELQTAQAALDAYTAPGARGRYTLVKLIGRGAYGAVYVAVERLPDAPPGPPPPEVTAPSSSSSAPGYRRVAIKHIVNAFVSPTDARRIYREIKVMSHFRHPNVLPLLEVVPPADGGGFTHIYLAAELCETDLHRVIHSRQDLSLDHVAYFLFQALCGLAHVHAAGVLHRDLKPSNLLVNGDCTLRMCDFGLARESDASLSAAFTEYVVTRYYRAPEVLLSGGRYSSAIDVWSVGCILAELLLRRPLLPGDNYLHQLQLVTEVLGSPTEDDLAFVRSPAARSFMARLPHSDGVPFSTLFPHVRGPVLDLLARMLAFDPGKRATVAECLAHPFLARVRAARRGVNEDVPPPGRFRLRLSGGSAALKALSVDTLKARFLAELCGTPLTPTPTAAPQQLRFDADGPPLEVAPAGCGAAPGGKPQGSGVTRVVEPDALPVLPPAPATAAAGGGVTATTAVVQRRASLTTTGAAAAAEKKRAALPGAAAPSRPKGDGTNGDAPEHRWSEEDWDSLEEDDADDDDGCDAAVDAASKAFYEREAAARQAQRAASVRAPDAGVAGGGAAEAAPSPMPGVPMSVSQQQYPQPPPLRAAASTEVGGASVRPRSGPLPGVPLTTMPSAPVVPSAGAGASSAVAKTAHEFVQRYQPPPPPPPPAVGQLHGHMQQQHQGAPRTAAAAATTSTAAPITARSFVTPGGAKLAAPAVGGLNRTWEAPAAPPLAAAAPPAAPVGKLSASSAVQRAPVAPSSSRLSSTLPAPGAGTTARRMSAPGAVALIQLKGGGHVPPPPPAAPVLAKPGAHGSAVAAGAARPGAATGGRR